MIQTDNPKRGVRWRRFLVKGTIWLSSELMLGLIGMDNLADYSEFLVQSRVANHVSAAITTITTLM